MGTEIPIEGFVDEGEEAVGNIYHFFNIRGNELAVCTGGIVEAQLFVLVLSVGDVSIDLGAIERGYSWTDMFLRDDDEVVPH